MESPWPVPIDTVSASASGTMLWTHVGRTTLTVVQKATLALSEGPMSLLPPEKLVIWERLDGDGSLAEDVELVPHKPRAEVQFVGSAHAPAPTAHLVARLSVRSEGRVLIDKSVRIIGDRVGGGEPAPFTKMPLGWKRTSFDPLRNPIGVQPGSGRAPNLYDPDDVSAAIAFAQVPRSWPMRARFIGQASAAKAGDLMGPRVEMQSDISWGYFLSTSEDQQATMLRGNEQIYLQHLVDGKPQFTAQLPQLRGVGRFTDGAGFEQALEFKLDTLIIDTDRMRLSGIWRATMPFAPTMKPTQCRVVVGVEVGGVAVDLNRKSSGQSGLMAAVAGSPNSAPAATRVFNAADLDGPPMTQRVESLAAAQGLSAYEAKPRDSSTNVFAQQPSTSNSFDFEPETSAADGGSSTGTLALTPEAASLLLAKSAAERKAPPPTLGMQLPAWGNAPPAPPPPPGFVPGQTAHMPLHASPLHAPSNALSAPVLVVRAGPDHFDDEDSVVGSTMAMSPESAAELLKRPQQTAPGSIGVPGRMPTGRSPARTNPPNPPPPAPPPPPPDLERHGTVEMERVPDSDRGGGTMVLNVNVPGTSRRG